ncbi:hypothetical protein GWI33_008631 [Rhynchophorus ferrugineus]|nr:hypothetical protein GWI33_008631 [Rhynchophorus ferrugineus]
MSVTDLILNILDLGRMAYTLRSQTFRRLYTVVKTYTRSSSSINKGLVLGLYNTENSEVFELSTAAQNYDQKVQGKLLEQIKL